MKPYGHILEKGGNMNKEIPQWSWYNTQFLFSFDEALKKNSNLTLNEFFTDFKQLHKLENISFHLKNQGTVISALYSLLVIPREIWESKEELGTSFRFLTKSEFCIIEGKDIAQNTWKFLRLMRNAISHAHFEIFIDKEEYVFWNYNPQDPEKKRNFEASISHQGLCEFIAEIGKYYINEVARKQGNQ